MDGQKIEQDKGSCTSQDATREMPRPQGAPDDYLRVAGDATTSPADRATASRRPVTLAALAALCVALIVGSLGFVHPGPDGGWSVAWLFQTTAEEPSDAADQGSSSRDSSSKADGEGDESGKGASEEADDEEDADTEASSSDASDGRTSSSAGGTDGSSASDGRDDAGSDGQAGTTPGSSGQSSSSSNGPSDEQGDTITVSVSVSSSAVGGPVSGGGTFTFKKGASAYDEKGVTAYDALCACGLSVNASNSAFGIYVSAIGGLAEKEHGEGSGWNYAVNGATPGISAGSYVLSDGDSVEWFYITG